MANNKHTAVDFLLSRLPLGVRNSLIEKGIEEQAKELEKEQIIDAALSLDSADNIWDKTIALELAEQYYKETYGE